MYARSTTFRGDPDDVDAGIALVREQIMPAILRMDGCVGLSMLVDRDTGGCVVTSSWESEQAMAATAQRVGPLRDRAAQLFGSRPEVREWEIAVLHRNRPVPDGACARVVWTQADPGQVEQQLDVFRTAVLPQVEDLPGFCSLSLLVDRRTGRAAAATTYESRAALRRTEDAATAVRSAATAQMAVDILDVAEFDVPLAHLRVPETV